MLAKRLVGQLSASDDYEESMISKLKVRFPVEKVSSNIDWSIEWIFSKRVVLNTHRNYNECFKMLVWVKIWSINIELIVKQRKSITEVCVHLSVSLIGERNRCFSGFFCDGPQFKFVAVFSSTEFHFTDRSNARSSSSPSFHSLPVEIHLR